MNEDESKSFDCPFTHAELHDRSKRISAVGFRRHERSELDLSIDNMNALYPGAYVGGNNKMNVKKILIELMVVVQELVRRCDRIEQVILSGDDRKDRRSVAGSDSDYS